MTQENSNQLPKNLEGCDGERGGGTFKQEGTRVNKPKVDSCCCSVEPMQYCNAIILQLKINKFFKKERKT